MNYRPHWLCVGYIACGIPHVMDDYGNLVSVDQWLREAAACGADWIGHYSDF